MSRFFVFILFLVATVASAEPRVIIAPNQAQDLKLQVNPTGSAAVDALTINGTTGVTSLSQPLPVASGGSGSSSGVTSSAIVDDTIVNADINSAAAIAGSKIQAASGSNAGVVSTGTQTLAGIKTFSAPVLLQGDGTSTAYLRSLGGGSGYTAASLQLIANDTGSSSRGGGVYVWNDTDDSTLYFGTVHAENTSFGILRKTSTATSDVAVIAPAADPNASTLLFKVQADASIRFNSVYMYHVSGGAGSSTCTTLCGTEPAGANASSGQCISAWTSAKAPSTCAASATFQLCLCTAFIGP